MGVDEKPISSEIAEMAILVDRLGKEAAAPDLSEPERAARKGAHTAVAEALREKLKTGPSASSVETITHAEYEARTKSYAAQKTARAIVAGTLRVVG